MNEPPITKAIGFTGTQRGMTTAQRQTVELLLRMPDVPHLTRFHHGDCVGADAEAHRIARMVGLYIVVHPPEIAAARAYCAADELWDERPYHVRNRDIVNSCTVLVATPATRQEILRSGTWATIRFARKRGKRIFVIEPSGRITPHIPEGPHAITV